MMLKKLKKSLMILGALIALEFVLFYAYSYMFFLDGHSSWSGSVWLDVAAWICIVLAIVLPLVVFTVFMFRNSHRS